METKTKKQIDDVKNFFRKSSSETIQNAIPLEAPKWTSRPMFFMNGIVKSVKIADEVFNYIDYLEAIGFECYTYAPRSVKEENLRKVNKALEKARRGPRK